MCLLIPWIRVLNLKKMLWIGVGCLVVFSVFTSMKATRTSGFEMLSISQIVGRGEEDKSTFMEKIAGKGSMEGLIRNMAMIKLHTTTHGYTYGKSIGFLAVFWIPRFIWENKPVQLDYWLIREYESGFSDSHSTASSFCGELFMDFGYFCIVLCAGLGALLAKMDAYISQRVLRGDFYSVVIAGLFFGWSLFMVRSILAASYQVILGAVVAFLFAHVFLRERIVENRTRAVGR